PPAVLRAAAGHRAGVAGADRGPAGRRRAADARMSAAGLLDGKVVVISGVGPGLGRGLALQCARAGADVVLAARNEERLAEVAKEFVAMRRRAVPGPVYNHSQAIIELTD